VHRQLERGELRGSRVVVDVSANGSGSGSANVSV
jgi:hypothetical protein